MSKLIQICHLTGFNVALRFQHDEAKILAWEEQEKAKAEAEMRRVEVAEFISLCTQATSCKISYMSRCLTWLTN